MISGYFSETRTFSGGRLEDSATHLCQRCSLVDLSMKEGVPILLSRNRWVRRVLNEGYGKAGLPFSVAPELTFETGGTGGLGDLVKREVGQGSAW